MKKILLGIILMVSILGCKSGGNYDDYVGYWETKKSSGIEVLEIRKEGKDYIYKIYSIKKSIAALTKDWKEAEDGVKITEKESGKLIRKYGGLYTEKDLEKAKSEVEEFNKLSAEEQKEFLIFLGTPNMKVNEENLAKGYYVMFDQLHYFTKLDSKNSDSTYFDKFLHYDKLDENAGEKIKKYDSK
ncbi:hypothetical protein [Sebaldella termitidis]|uniref:hypothetical protein n=1 Tax=Sebaldella termitidis TaxID=826 RepID=UPI003EBA75C8